MSPAFGGVLLQSDGLGVSQLLFLTPLYSHVSTLVAWPVCLQVSFDLFGHFFSCANFVNCKHTLDLTDQMWGLCALHDILFLDCIVAWNFLNYDDVSSALTSIHHYTQALCLNSTCLQTRNASISLCCTLMLLSKHTNYADVWCKCGQQVNAYMKTLCMETSCLEHLAPSITWP